MGILLFLLNQFGVICVNPIPILGKWGGGGGSLQLNKIKDFKALESKHRTLLTLGSLYMTFLLFL